MDLYHVQPMFITNGVHVDFTRALRCAETVGSMKRLNMEQPGMSRYFLPHVLIGSYKGWTMAMWFGNCVSCHACAVSSQSLRGFPGGAWFPPTIPCNVARSSTLSTKEVLDHGTTIFARVVWRPTTPTDFRLPLRCLGRGRVAITFLFPWVFLFIIVICVAL